VDDAMAALERDNPALKGVLPKDYARPALDKTRLGQLIDQISNTAVNVSDWRGDLLMMDKRWQFGVPPAGNANFAWV
jgi:type I restriction-modification system DNA methylase subunit